MSSNQILRDDTQFHRANISKPSEIQKKKSTSLSSISIEKTRRKKTKNKLKRAHDAYNFDGTDKDSSDDDISSDENAPEGELNRKTARDAKTLRRKKMKCDNSWTLEEKASVPGTSSQSEPTTLLIQSSTPNDVTTNKRTKVDHAIQSKFPAYLHNGKNKRWLTNSTGPLSNETLPVSSKAYASVADAHRFLEQLRDSSVKVLDEANSLTNNAKSPSKMLEPTLIIIRFLFLVRLARQGKISTQNLLSRMKGILPPDLFEAFGAFIPSVYFMENVLPVDCPRGTDMMPLNNNPSYGISARTDIQIIWDRKKRSVMTQRRSQPDTTVHDNSSSKDRSNEMDISDQPKITNEGNMESSVQQKLGTPNGDSLVKSKSFKPQISAVNAKIQNTMISKQEVKSVSNHVPRPKHTPVATTYTFTTKTSDLSHTNKGHTINNETVTQKEMKSKTFVQKQLPNNQNIPKVFSPHEKQSQKLTMVNNEGKQNTHLQAQHQATNQNILLTQQQQFEQAMKSKPSGQSFEQSNKFIQPERPPITVTGQALPQTPPYHGVPVSAGAVNKNDLQQLKSVPNAGAMINNNMQLQGVNKLGQPHLQMPQSYLPFNFSGSYPLGLLHANNQGSKASAAILQQNQRMLQQQLFLQQQNQQQLAFAQSQLANSQRKKTPTVITIDDNTPKETDNNPPAVKVQHGTTPHVNDMRKHVAHPQMNLQTPHQQLPTNHHQSVLNPMLKNQNGMFGPPGHIHNGRPNPAPTNNGLERVLNQNSYPSTRYNASPSPASNVINIKDMTHRGNAPGMRNNVTTLPGNVRTLNMNQVPLSATNKQPGSLAKVSQAPGTFISNTVGGSSTAPRNQIGTSVHGMNVPKQYNNNSQSKIAKSQPPGSISKTIPKVSGNSNLAPTGVKRIQSKPGANGANVGEDVSATVNPTMNNTNTGNNAKPYDGLTKPVRAKNPFTHFCRMMKPFIRAELCRGNNNIPIANLKDKIQEETQFRWRALRDEEKQVFVHKSVLDFNRYELEMSVYKEVQQKRLEMGLVSKADLSWD